MISKKNISHYNSTIQSSENINKECASLTKIIRTSANLSIPLSKRNKNYSKNVPWWNLKLKELRDQKQLAWREFRNNMCNENLIKYKKQNALFTREKKLAKALCFEEFTKMLNPRLDTGSIWKHVRTLTGKYRPFIINSITSNNCTISDPKTLSSKFAIFCIPIPTRIY